MRKILWISALMGILFFSLNPAFSQEAKPEAKPQMRKEVVRLKYVRARDMNIILRSFSSREGMIIWATDNETLLAISDYPEIVEKMLSIIKEIDIKPVDLLFTVQLVLGSETGDGKTDELLQDDPIVNELKKVLRYKTFSLLDTSLIRALDQGRAKITLGKNTEFDLQIRPKYVKEEKDEIIQMEVRLSRIDQGDKKKTTDPKTGATNVTGPTSTTLIETQLTMKSGEKTVVGVSKLDGGDKGLILIISGKVVS